MRIAIVGAGKLGLKVINALVGGDEAASVHAKAVKCPRHNRV